jgi:hypothetical protein
VVDKLSKEFFSKQDNVEAWLFRKPREIAVAVAVRSALRSAPMIIAAFDRLGGVAKASRAIFLPSFRAMAAGWVTIQYPAREVDLRLAAAIAAAEAAAKAADSYAVTGAASAARASANATRASVEAGRGAVAFAAVSLASEAVWNATLAVRADALAGEPAVRTLDFADALAADAAQIDQALKTHVHASKIAEELARQPVWPRGIPHWASGTWAQLERILHLDSPDWKAWTDWYRNRLEGGPSNESLEIARVLTPREIWDKPPEDVNTYINRLTKEYEEPFPETIPLVPPQRPAAIEPIWSANVLTLPTEPPLVDLNSTEISALLSSLRADLREFADDIASEGNIDRRFPPFVRGLCERIPETVPPQHELFSIAHAEEIFIRFGATVDNEWPDLLAARYHALALQFDRAMRQFPTWRNFKHNAARQSLTLEQAATIAPLATAAASAFRSEGAEEFIDPVIPRALERLAGSLQALDQDLVEVTRHYDPASDNVAFDIVESINNVLKRAAEVALATARTAGKTMQEAGRRYQEEFKTAFLEHAGKSGRRHGEKVINWLNRVVFFGATAGLAQLIGVYPRMFEWLPGLIKTLSKFH